MINRRRALRRPYRLPTRSIDQLVSDAATQPPTQTAKPRRTPRKVKRREDVNAALCDADMDALGCMHWFLVRVASSKEFAAERILAEAGLIVFVPVETRFRRKNGVVKSKEAKKYPLIPGYLLVAFAPAPSMEDYPWHRLFRFSIVGRVVGHQGRPMVLPFGQIRRLLERHSAGDFLAPDEQRFMQSGREFRQGDRVEILSGVFEGHVSEVTEIRGQTAHVLLRIFGGDREVEVGLADLGRVA